MLSTLMMLTLAAALAAEAPSAPEWQADYGKALTETRNAERPLLVVLDIPSDESQRLNPELLAPAKGDSPLAIAKPLASYELCHVDASTEYGKEVAKAFNVTQFPHVAIIDKTGSVILKRLSGDLTADQWQAALASHESGLRKSGSRYSVSKPVLGGASALSLPEESAPAKPYCKSCQRKGS